MTDFAIRRTDQQIPDDKTWAASIHGFDTARSGTLDITSFDETTHYPNGYIPSGTVLGYNEAEDTWVAVDGTVVATFDGILFEAVNVRPGQEIAAIAILDHGIVHGERLRGATLPVEPSAGSAIKIR